jgi:hypothetical protein
MTLQHRALVHDHSGRSEIRPWAKISGNLAGTVSGEITATQRIEIVFGSLAPRLLLSRDAVLQSLEQLDGGKG